MTPEMQYKSPVRRWLEEHHMTQREFTVLIGASENTAVRYVAGKAIPTGARLENLVRLTGISREELAAGALPADMYQARDADKKYRIAHREQLVAYKKKYNADNRERWRQNRVLHRDQYRAKQARKRAERRKLGFIPLNASFPGAEGHHIDMKHVVYIPRELHQSVSHNVRTGKNMDRINAAAIQWLRGGDTMNHMDIARDVKSILKAGGLEVPENEERLRTVLVCAFANPATNVLGCKLLDAMNAHSDNQLRAVAEEELTT